MGERNWYVALMEISVPALESPTAVFPARVGHAAEFDWQEVSGLQVTVPPEAADVNVTFSRPGGIPAALPARMFAICSTVVEQACPTQSAPCSAAYRAVSFTASASVWYCHIPIPIQNSEIVTKRRGMAQSVNSTITEPRRRHGAGMGVRVGI